MEGEEEEEGTKLKLEFYCPTSVVFF